MAIYEIDACRALERLMEALDEAAAPYEGKSLAERAMDAAEIQAYTKPETFYMTQVNYVLLELVLQRYEEELKAASEIVETLHRRLCRGVEEQRMAS